MRAVVVALLIACASATVAHADGGLAPAKDPDGTAHPGSGAAAEPLTPTEPLPAHDPSKGPFFHDGQFGISARFALGLRGITTYHDTDYCGSTSTDTSTGNAPLCLTRAPFALELEMAYGVGKRIDLLLEMQLGIERDFGSSASANDGPHTVRLSPGLRYFFSEGRTTKLFTTAQAVFDFTGFKDIAGVGRGADFGVRNLNGLWFDFHRSYGLYIFAGETLSVARWLNLELEAGVGIQARYP